MEKTVCFLQTGAAQGLVFSAVSMLGLGHEGSSEVPSLATNVEACEQRLQTLGQKEP